MIRFEDECVGCSSMGLPCYGSACPNKNVMVCYCDECGDALNEDGLYDIGDGKMLCDFCALNKIRKPVEQWYS